MGIAANAVVIVLGGLLGSRLQKIVTKESYQTLGICIAIVSLVGFFENIYRVSGQNIASESLMVVLMAFLVGSKLGELLRLEERLSNLGAGRQKTRGGVLDAFLYFGVGGMQICGPILLATQGDNSQLFLKSLIDIPFAIVFGAAYGKTAALAAVPVALVQLVIAGAAWLFRGLFTDGMITQLCAVGYIILFFTGFNLIAGGKQRISNLNMLPGVLLVLVFCGVKERVL